MSLVTRDGRPLVESEPLLSAGTVDIQPLAFGDLDFSTKRIVEHPAEGAWREARYDTPQVRVYRLRDACVHSSAGVVMVANRLVAETLQHIDPAEHGLTVDEDTGFTTLNSRGVRHLAGRAVHLLAGAADNYYHWHIDVVARLSALPDAYRDDLILVPPLRHAFQRETLERLAADRPMRLLALDAGESLLVDELVLVPNLGGFGRYPRPEMLSVFDRLAEGVGSAGRHRRLYVQRTRSPKRRLREEPAIRDLLAAAGYEPLDLDSLTLAEQIGRFAEATHVIGPHGAGLTNLVFCRPETRVFELHMDCYTNWLFRRLANLRRLPYGCLVGAIDGPWQPFWPHDSAWTLPVDRLSATLRAAGFLD